MAADAPERRRSVTGLVPAAAVAVTIAAVVFGGYAVGGALSRSAGPTVDVAGAARIQPLSGWEVAGRFDEPPGVRLTRGGGNLDVIAVPFRGSAEDLLDRYVDRVLRPEAGRLSVSGAVEDVRLASGLPGARIAYVGSFGRALTPIEGEITAVVSLSGVGVVLDAWGPTGVLRYIREDARAMTDTAEVV
jgi:hypothetical protein